MSIHYNNFKHKKKKLKHLMVVKFIVKVITWSFDFLGKIYWWLLVVDDSEHIEKTIITIDSYGVKKLILSGSQ